MKEKKHKCAEPPAATDANAEVCPASPVSMPAAKKLKRGKEMEMEKEEKGCKVAEQAQGGDMGTVPKPDTMPPAEGGKSMEKEASKGRKEWKCKQLAAGCVPPVSTTDSTPTSTPTPAPSTVPGSPGANEQLSPKKKRNCKSKNVEVTQYYHQRTVLGHRASDVLWCRT
ncbi:hypothetical protein WOLCODRAFT_148556 [Wolfiporia cocos MD-104 SS10]|uniref:Uncharacterized protein n=1 Tax=Wolfiporia cocos (strain MD-104) TaxID=742152 RepID=A0A2H3JA10_WOLCO|nr:hypothetical protein WOLCODRAFT_148556 [Wolfiporia cocos MD-104 SS10]